MGSLATRRPADCFDPAVARFLEACSEHYDALAAAVQGFRSRGSPEAALTWVEMAAEFAAMHHPGRFADGSIENVALEAGRHAARAVRTWQPWRIGEDRPQEVTRVRRVLHVASTLLSVGGHTRTILNWVRSDRCSRHFVVSTSSAGIEIPTELMQAVADSGGQLATLPDAAPLIDRGHWLREFARTHADLVFLHLVPGDVVPIIAFSEPGGPPIALVNLADQCFWLGSTIADSVVHLRGIGQSSSQDLRFTRNDCLLPIPLAEAGRPLSRQEARDRLGIPHSQLMLLSVGRPVKYAPSTRVNFFRAAGEVLHRNPDAHIYLVGVQPADHLAKRGVVRHERMHLVGTVKDASVFQHAADVYLEGFPFGSQTALLESVLPGNPCVRAVMPATPLLATDDPALTGIVDNPAGEAEYVESTSALIADPERRRHLGAILRQRVLRFHVAESWNEHLEGIYGHLANLRHVPERIPGCHGSSRTVDLAISEYHATRFSCDEPSRMVPGERAKAIKDAAFWLRERGFHADSFRMLRHANLNRRWDLGSMYFVAKLLPHRAGFALRRLLLSFAANR